MAEKLLQERLAAAREVWSKELGVEETEKKHFKRPMERAFTRNQREKTTILYGGLTWKHERLIQGVFHAMGYSAEPIPAPDVPAFQLGKEYGNNGQCNPTYFTVGNLVQYLQKMEAKGIDRKSICDNYVFFTAGACGPCRFGMYEAEYRLALRNSGFGDFRVLIFGQDEGVKRGDKKDGGAGLDMNLELYLMILNCISMGDLVNEVAYQIRPYEVNKGETEYTLKEAMDYLYGEIVAAGTEPGKGDHLKLLPKMVGKFEYIGNILRFLHNERYLKACEHVRDMFSKIKVDRTRCKPIVKITGEFFAQTTEGDGNFNMFTFLEREGAEVIVEPVGNWINYLINQAKVKIKDKKDLSDYYEIPPTRRVFKRLKAELRARKILAALSVGGRLLEKQYDNIREALGGTAHHLTNQTTLQRLGDPYYNIHGGGGEGHLEVAKNIYYHNKKMAHMVLSLKPFGCMPSTQSDGAQSAVVNHYKDMIYIPIETSGEGAINGHSRVQMALGEAKFKAKNEYAEVLRNTGYTLDQVKAYTNSHPELSNPHYIVPKQKEIAGTAANFVYHVAQRMREAGIERLPAMAA
ncbi:MAG TPA: activator of (R)-2-hydroxyglutaryl-CoA dehydratase [Bdellovibrionota bacterium]|nr:activator of (R)-2-hydroxyglutaryl-CoA dehydratase [Bdellovibrionota bacterium]